MNRLVNLPGRINKIGDSPAIGRSAPPVGCVLHLSGLPGGGNKIYDRSPYGNIGTITGAVWKRLPSGLWYLDYDGSDDKVVIANESNFDFTDTITIIMWVKPGTQTTAYAAIISKELLIIIVVVIANDQKYLYFTSQSNN